MKPLLIFGMFLALTVAGASEPQKARVDGHSDGEVRLPVAIRVIDALSGAPISDVRIRFYDEVALAILASIDAAQKKGRTPEDKIPTGVVARTSQDGSAVITCGFNAGFLWSFENGARKDVGTDVYPSGRFVVSKQGYRTLNRSAHDIFRTPPYSPDQLKVPVALQLEKEANQLLRATEPNQAVQRTRFARR